jgi:hypothetical protein
MGVATPLEDGDVVEKAIFADQETFVIATKPSQNAEQTALPAYLDGFLWSSTWMQRPRDLVDGRLGRYETR